MVIKNNDYTIDITGMTHEGQGVGKIDSFTVFVEGASIGETVKTKIIKVTKSYAVGKLLEILEKSPDRVEPFCTSYKRCGGCSLQHLKYEAQLKYKTGVVKDALKRIGKIEDVVIHDAIGMQTPLNYRNKAQFPVGLADGKPILGFYAKRSHEIIDNKECGIQDPVSNGIREIVRDFIIENEISVYDETTQKGLIRHLMVRSGFKTGEVMVVVVINGRDIPKRQELVEKLIAVDLGQNSDGKAFKVTSVFLNINKKDTNVILGEKNIKIYGSNTITDYIGKYKFNISPHSFFQVNPVQTEVLYGKALEYAALTGKETVFDLFCGIGTISLFLSEKAKKVYGVEVVEAAMLDARKNAEVNGVHNAEFIVGEAEKVIPEIYESGVRADVVVVDPPRKGCDEVLLKTLVDMQPERIVYVSCNPSTLARDLNYLEGNGYKAVEVQPVDMFPWTYHVEAIILMTKCGSDTKK